MTVTRQVDRKMMPLSSAFFSSLFFRLLLSPFSLPLLPLSFASSAYLFTSLPLSLIFSIFLLWRFILLSLHLCTLFLHLISSRPFAFLNLFPFCSSAKNRLVDSFDLVLIKLLLPPFFEQRRLPFAALSRRSGSAALQGALSF